MKIKIEISPGELIDKLTILDIKLEKIHDPDKVKNVRIEKETIQPQAKEIFRSNSELHKLFLDLKSINLELWEIEDKIRHCEARGDFGEKFIELARSVYLTNDRRARVKREINEHLNSTLKEEKQYVDYASRGA